MSIEPVVGDESDPYAIREEDLPQIFDEYDKLARYIIEKDKKGEGFNFFHFMIDLEGGPCLYKRLSGCGSGTEYLAVTPWGDFYPCHQFVGDENFLMGNVNEGITRPEISSVAAMYIPKKNARNVLQDSTAVAGVWQTHTSMQTD